VLKMAEEENDTNKEQEMKEIENIEEKGEVKRAFEKTIEDWQPKTEIGRKVKSKEITDIDMILDNGKKVLEPEIVDALLPNLTTDLLLIGQAKGKFGGGQRRVFKQTQKKTQEGNKPKFATFAVVGNSDGYVGIGYGKSKETVPAREKAIRKSKLNIIKIRRGCGSWECGCKEPHSIPFAVKGKCGSVEIELLPAPKGTGLKTEKETQKILKLAGIKDVWSKSRGQLKSKINLINAVNEALENLMATKVSPDKYKILGIIEGKQEIKEEEDEQ
jgi:small subunit ribosomal protein S5